MKCLEASILNKMMPAVCRFTIRYDFHWLKFKQLLLFVTEPCSPTNCFIFCILWNVSQLLARLFFGIWSMEILMSARITWEYRYCSFIQSLILSIERTKNWEKNRYTHAQSNSKRNSWVNNMKVYAVSCRSFTSLFTCWIWIYIFVWVWNNDNNHNFLYVYNKLIDASVCVLCLCLCECFLSSFKLKSRSTHRTTLFAIFFVWRLGDFCMFVVWETIK